MCTCLCTIANKNQGRCRSVSKGKGIKRWRRGGKWDKKIKRVMYQLHKKNVNNMCWKYVSNNRKGSRDIEGDRKEGREYG